MMVWAVHHFHLAMLNVKYGERNCLFSQSDAGKVFSSFRISSTLTWMLNLCKYIFLMLERTTSRIFDFCSCWYIFHIWYALFCSIMRWKQQLIHSNSFIFAIDLQWKKERKKACYSKNQMSKFSVPLKLGYEKKKSLSLCPFNIALEWDWWNDIHTFNRCKSLGCGYQFVSHTHFDVPYKKKTNFIFVF